MNIGYQVNLSAEERVAVIEEYRKALRDFPLWAVDEAYNVAAREIPRRATPAELVILANRVRKPITDELAQREKLSNAALQAKAEAEKKPVSREEAKRIMDAAGFTFKRFIDIRERPMANTWTEVEHLNNVDVPTRHWSDGKTDNSPEMFALRASRAANPIMAAAMVKALNDRDTT